MANLNNMKIVAQELLKDGWEPHWVAGFVGRFGQESSYNPSAMRKNDAGPGKHSYGLYQANRKRADFLFKVGAEHGLSREQTLKDIRVQAKAAIRDLKELHPHLWKELQGAKTVKDAARVAMKFEGPKDSYHVKNGQVVWTPEKGHGWNNTLRNAAVVAKTIGVDPEKFKNMDFKAEAQMPSEGRPGTGVISDNPRAFKGDPAPTPVDTYNEIVSKVGTEIKTAAPSATSPVTSFVSSLLASNQQKQQAAAASHMTLSQMASTFAPKLKWASL